MGLPLLHSIHWYPVTQAIDYKLFSLCFTLVTDTIAECLSELVDFFPKFKPNIKLQQPAINFPYLLVTSRPFPTSVLVSKQLFRQYREVSLDCLYTLQYDCCMWMYMLYRTVDHWCLSSACCRCHRIACTVFRD